jgi:putative tricarboxylic transport membrane protein
MLLNALFELLNPKIFLLLIAGVTWGLVFGSIPGLTASLAIVVLLPVTYGMTPVHGISMLVAIFMGAQSAGLVSAILIGMPGTPASIATTFDGYPLAKKGYSRKALGIGITSNLVGCIIGGIFLLTLAPVIARLALKFGPYEYVAVIFFAFTAVVSLSGDSLYKGMLGTFFGLLVATVGTDPIYSAPRNTLGIDALQGGVSEVPAMIGLFVVSQVFSEMENLSQEFLFPKPLKSKLFPTLQEWKEQAFNFFRSGIIGVLIGILPGIGGPLANILAYDQAKKGAKHPEEYGTGDIGGIIAPEVANNAAVGGALIPMLSLGIPGDGVTAILLGGLMLHGLTPGPVLITQNPGIVYGIFGSYILSSLIMFFVMIAGIRVFPRLLRLRKSYILSVILAFGIIGCYNLQYSTTDIWIAFAFGLLGYLLKKNDYPIAPVIIAVILGRTFETKLMLGLMLFNSSLLPLFTRPISLGFILLAFISLAVSLRKMFQVKKDNFISQVD